MLSYYERMIFAVLQNTQYSVPKEIYGKIWQIAQNLIYNLKLPSSKSRLKAVEYVSDETPFISLLS